MSPVKDILVVLFICSFDHFAYGRRRNVIFRSDDPCLPNGGVCTKFNECPEALAKFRQNPSAYRPQLCSVESDVPVICCDRTPSALETPTAVPLRSAKRISKSKCEEYKASLKNVTCDHTQTGLIHGGQEANAFEFPHMALLGEKLSNGEYFWKCGGALISEEWILTAAHCINNDQPLTVRLGEHDLDDSLDAIPSDYQVIKVVIHPDWGKRRRIIVRNHKLFFQFGRDELGYHDIALLQLNQKVPFRYTIHPACLATDDDQLPQGSNVTVTGWGTTSFGGKASSVLLKVSVPLYGSSDCDALISRYPFALGRVYPEGATGRVLCAGKEGKDSCQGDSGGPMTIPRTPDSCLYTVLGIVSKGFGCGTELPGFYTKVSSYLDWIEGIVWNANS
ncbi:unnamed protein product [Darwinula stevensoni]|uniref:Peptidase S1 domain-containing protein n=1 Tax=Darwinula stevensoni TaxID=69355 RepID=A0A7R8XFK6_9CRUS|nr:unnamed protein product [Darwinula stevensoni]CAG0895637.1 unnamed protein product [Darwinula stevensoni]